MGFRTVVMLMNDRADEWSKDAELGAKIASAMNSKGKLDSYGAVVECTHGDSQTLAVLDGYTYFKEVGFGSWIRGQSYDEIAVKLLEDAAERMGYKLTKKRAPK